MKKIVNFMIVTAFMVAGTAVLAEEYGANDYTGAVSAESFAEVQMADNTDDSQLAAVDTPAAEEESEGTAKCFWGRQYTCWNSYYYTPCVYYYRPCIYYRTYTYSRTYYYRYRYITFYQSACVKSASNGGGIMINENPNTGTPLAAQGVVKGDVITHIDGKSITDPRQIDSISATSKLVVIKINGSTVPSDVIAPDVQEAEYGAFEY